MKKLLLILTLSILSIGCTKDEQPIIETFKKDLSKPFTLEIVSEEVRTNSGEWSVKRYPAQSIEWNPLTKEITLVYSDRVKVYNNCNIYSPENLITFEEIVSLNNILCFHQVDFNDPDKVLQVINIGNGTTEIKYSLR